MPLNDDCYEADTTEKVSLVVLIAIYSLLIILFTVTVGWKIFTVVE